MRFIHFCASLVAMGTICSAMSTFGADNSDNADESLRDRMEESIQSQMESPKKVYWMDSARTAIPALQSLRFKTPRCSDAQVTEFGDKYVLSRDESGQPCRIYDLSFPTLQSVFSKRVVSKLPVQPLKAKHYLNW